MFIVNLKEVVIGESEKGGNLYDLHIIHSTAHMPAWLTLDVLHKRLGHPGLTTLQRMIQKGLVKGIDVRDIEKLPNHVCDACIKAKMTSLPFNLGHKCATKRLEQVHSDLCGEFKHPSLGGNQYFTTLIDDMSGVMWVHSLKHKGDFVDWFMEMDATFANQYG